MKQKKGFVFIETIIVIAVLTTALVLLYSMFTSVLSQEKRRTSFEDVAYLYRSYYLTKFYNESAKRSMTYGIDEKNPIVSIPLTSDTAKDFLVEKEQGFYEQLVGSSFGITNVYLAGSNIGDLEKCNPSKTSCDVLEDVAGNNWKSYLKTLYQNDSGYRLITVFGNGDNKYGSSCFDVFEGNLTTNDSTCNFYYSSIPIRNLYKDNSGAEYPVLNNGLFPVVWNGTEWEKADLSKKWYDYDEQWWANGVTVSESTRKKYTDAPDGTPISMNDIETMWVWVPRYEYQHTNLGDQYAGGTRGQPGAISINFLSRDIITPSSSNFTIHDAFWWDDNNNGVKDISEQLSGIWVAKFEMSTGTTECTPASSDVEIGCDLVNIKPHIKPNVTSWRGVRHATMWTAIYQNMNGENNLYGLTNSDTHLMKNMDWGAVAFLSHSKYGKYGNSDYTGVNKEIYQNKSENYITGNSNGTPSTSSYEAGAQSTYNVEEKGTGASTTGNIYGIYDMNGGSYEYVMAVMAAPGNIEPAISRESGWSGKYWYVYEWREYEGTYDRLGDNPITEDVEGIGGKYYDLYNYIENTESLNLLTRKGDAINETKGWYYGSLGSRHQHSTLLSRGAANINNIGNGIFFYDWDFKGASIRESGRPVMVQVG